MVEVGPKSVKVGPIRSKSGSRGPKRGPDWPSVGGKFDRCRATVGRSRAKSSRSGRNRSKLGRCRWRRSSSKSEHCQAESGSGFLGGPLFSPVCRRPMLDNSTLLWICRASPPHALNLSGNRANGRSDGRSDAVGRSGTLAVGRAATWSDGLSVCRTLGWLGRSDRRAIGRSDGRPGGRDGRKTKYQGLPGPGRAAAPGAEIIWPSFAKSGQFGPVLPESWPVPKHRPKFDHNLQISVDVCHMLAELGQIDLSLVEVCHDQIRPISANLGGI